LPDAKRRGCSISLISDAMKEKLLSEDIRNWKWAKADMKKEMAEKIFEE
jgi:hypothetical protein